MINKVILMGRLCADPELKTTQSGIAVCGFGLPSIGSIAKAAKKKRILSTSSAGGSKRNLSAGISARGR